MCGIIGINSITEFSSAWAFGRLKRLEYRGYDSFGYYDGENLIKEVGHITVHNTRHNVNMAILHTRWQHMAA